MHGALQAHRAAKGKIQSSRLNSSAVPWVAHWPVTPRIPKALFSSVRVQVVGEPLDDVSLLIVEQNFVFLLGHWGSLLIRHKRHATSALAPLDAAVAWKGVGVHATDVR
jgi:hypothetical protein